MILEQPQARTTLLYRRQEDANDVGVERNLAIAEFAEQIFGHMSEAFERFQSEKARPALDGVHRAKDAAEQILGLRILL